MKVRTIYKMIRAKKMMKTNMKMLTLLKELRY
jgi:hypothetical protein